VSIGPLPARLGMLEGVNGDPAAGQLGGGSPPRWKESMSLILRDGRRWIEQAIDWASVHQVGAHEAGDAQ
jgi:hypothetical protein